MQEPEALWIRGTDPIPVALVSPLQSLQTQVQLGSDGPLRRFSWPFRSLQSALKPYPPNSANAGDPHPSMPSSSRKFSLSSGCWRLPALSMNTKRDGSLLRTSGEEDGQGQPFVRAECKWSHSVHFKGILSCLCLNAPVYSHGPMAKGSFYTSTGCHLRGSSQQP